MRSRSLMALLFICFTTLGLAGCGGSGTSTEFVATNPAAPPNTGALTFNFLTAQQAFTVDENTARLRFEFFENAGALGAPLVVTSADFAPSVTVSGLSTTIRSVKITGFDANRIPLFTIVQAVTVVGGENTTVNAVADADPVTLDFLELSAAGTVDGERLDSVQLEVNGTGQVYLIATYSDGTELVVGDAATYSNDPNDPDSTTVLQVGEFGQLRGLSAGATNLIAEFGGQSLSIPVSVSPALSVTFSSIDILNADPISVPSGSQQSLSVSGTRASDNFVFGISPTSPSLSFSVSGDSGISVANGVISVAALTPGGASALLTASYLNADGTTVTDTATITVSGAAGVDSVTAAADQTSLFSGAPALVSQITITEVLTDNTSRTGDPADYDYVSSNEGAAIVSPLGVVTAVGPGSTTITVTNTLNSTLTADVDITVVNATVTGADIVPLGTTVPAGQSQTFQLSVTLSNSQVIEVTNLSTFAISDIVNFTVVENVVTANANAPGGTSTSVTGSFDPDGDGPLLPVPSATSLAVQ